jgi:hypothetical protein
MSEECDIVVVADFRDNLISALASGPERRVGSKLKIETVWHLG